MAKTMNHATPLPGEPPTRIRFIVLAYLCGVTFILYLDRMCIGKAAPFIQDELHLSDFQMGMVHASFMLAYGLFEVASGHLADRYGTRKILTRIVLWWSAFTVLTGTATGFAMLLMTRFLFGAGEAGALPNVSRIVDQWFPVLARGKIRGFVHMPALLGGMIAPLMTAYLIDSVGWRWVFALYGMAGAAWSVAFYRFFRDYPANHSAVNAVERELIGPPPVYEGHAHLPITPIVRSLNVWLLSCVMITGSSTVYLIFAWYPTYLEKLHGVSNVTSGWLNSCIMFCGAAGCLIGGWLVDVARRRVIHARWEKSVVGTAGFAIAAVGMCAASSTGSVEWKTAWLGITCLGIHMHAAAWWGVNSAISGRHTAAVFGVINSMGALGGAVAQLAFGSLNRESWDAAFYVAGALLLLGAICWSRVDARREVFTGQE